MTINMFVCIYHYIQNMDILIHTVGQKWKYRVDNELVQI